jgi:hypothetical protein
MSRISGISAGHLSHLEHGTRALTEKVAIKLDDAMPERRGWFLEYHQDSREWAPPGYRNWSEYEDRAASLVAWMPGQLHGLVQTPAYARALLGTFPVASNVLEARLAGRMERRKRVLSHGRAVTILVDELSLYRRVGSPATMAGQMHDLIELSDAPDVTVQVVPAIEQPATASEVIVTDTAAYAEHIVSGAVYDDQTVTDLRRMLTRMQGDAMRISESKDLIGRLKTIWTNSQSTNGNPLTAAMVAQAASRSANSASE